MGRRCATVRRAEGLGPLGLTPHGSIFALFSAVALPKYSRNLSFCRLASGRNHQKSPLSPKV